MYCSFHTKPYKTKIIYYSIQAIKQMFALLYRSAEVFHMTQFSHITNRWLPLYLADNANAIIDSDDIKTIEHYLSNHVNEMWKKYL